MQQSIQNLEVWHNGQPTCTRWKATYLLGYGKKQVVQAT